MRGETGETRTAWVEERLGTNKVRTKTGYRERTDMGGGSDKKGTGRVPKEEMSVRT